MIVYAVEQRFAGEWDGIDGIFSTADLAKQFVKTAIAKYRHSDSDITWKVNKDGWSSAFDGYDIYIITFQLDRGNSF